MACDTVRIEQLHFIHEDTEKGKKGEPEARAAAHSEAVACPACGDFSLQQRGAAWVCDTCGAAPALKGGDQG